MVIDSLLLDKLTAQAKESPRLRMNLDLKTSETVVVLRGRVVEEYYDDAGVLVESFVLGDCHVADAPRNDMPVTCALNIPAGQWHTLRALESGTVILEMKDGAYESITPVDIFSM